MNWATILLMMAKILAKKYSWYGLFFHREINDSNLSAEVDQQVPEKVFAAPSELQAAIIEFLRSAVAKANVGVIGRIVLGRAIDLVPVIIDQLWDMLFSQKLVGVPFKEHPDNAALYSTPVEENAVPPEALQLLEV